MALTGCDGAGSSSGNVPGLPPVALELFRGSEGDPNAISAHTAGWPDQLSFLDAMLASPLTAAVRLSEWSGKVNGLVELSPNGER